MSLSSMRSGAGWEMSAVAEIRFDGLDTFVLSMRQVAELPDDVHDAMLNAGADVVVEAQRAEARKLGKFSGYRNSRQRRDYSTGITAECIKKGKVKVKNGERCIYVTPTGTRRRGNTTTRNAEIAYVNEYGTDSIQARGFIRKASEKCADETTTAEFMVYNRFLESKNL
nr:MAG TPA: hypothetical protein [Caudoviricetes sp.]